MVQDQKESEMDLTTPVTQVVQKQATIGDLLNDYMHGLGITQISEKWGIHIDKVAQVIKQADAEGKFIPPGIEAPIDKVTPTPSKVAQVDEGTPPPATMATTKNTKA